MDGFTTFDVTRLRRSEASPSRPATLALPDLDAPPPAPEPEGPGLESLLADAFEAGRVSGEAQGREAGIADASRRAEARIAESLGAIERALAAARADARALADEAVRELAAVALAVIDAALPATAARGAPDAIARFAANLRPHLDDAPEAVLHVAPSLVEAITARVPGIPVEPDPALPEGDARLSWRDGSAAIDLAARRAAIRAALAEQGLIETESDA